MSSGSIATNATYWEMPRNGGGVVACFRSEGTTVVTVDRSQESPLKGGAISVNAFLDEFDADPSVAKHLPEARRDLASSCLAAGTPTIKILRLKAGLSQQQFADAVGSTQGNISLIENRKQKPGEDLIRSMRNALDVSFDTLMEALANG